MKFSNEKVDLDKKTPMSETQIPRKLKMLGMLLFLLGLITGFLLTNFKNPRMGLAAHLEGVMNGVFLVVAGLIWHDLNISKALKKITCGTLIYGTYVNWLITLLAALLGTSKMTPITGNGFIGTPLHEQIVNAGFISVGLTMVFSLLVIVYGLRSLKALAAVIAIMAFTTFTPCRSQSIVGKWKNYYIIR
jgi:(hydroxyamino)benzene mutase